MKKITKLFSTQSQFFKVKHSFSNVNFKVKSLDNIIQGQLIGQEGQVLAHVLQKYQVPLEFDCGFCCECCTCAVQFETMEDYDLINDKQPLQPDEELLLKMDKKAPKTRLSCQLKVTKELEGKTLVIE